jgi:hypothetical protein
MPLDTHGFNRRGFNAGQVFNPAAIVYYVYAGDSNGGPVDYSRLIGQTYLLTFDSVPLAHSTSTRFGVRVHSSVTGLTEQNTDAQVFIVVGPAGEDLSNLPPAPVGLTVRAAKGGTAVVEWAYPYLKLPSLPTGFHVYLTAGSTLDYATPAATVPYGPASLPIAFRRPQPGNYRATLTGLADGTSYVVGVRAYNAAGEEANTVALSVVGDTTAPLNVANLTATLTTGP